MHKRPFRIPKQHSLTAQILSHSKSLKAVSSLGRSASLAGYTHKVYLFLSKAASDSIVGGAEALVKDDSYYESLVELTKNWEIGRCEKAQAHM